MKLARFYSLCARLEDHVSALAVEPLLAPAALQVAKLKGALKELRAELAAAKAERDEFSIHLYATRQEQRRLEADTGPRAERLLKVLHDRSFATACQFGFKGSPEQWTHLVTLSPARKES